MAIVWILTTKGVWTSTDNQTYPPSRFGVARNIFLGKMECAGRLVDIDHVQTWCIKKGKVTDNAVTDIGTSAVALDYSDITEGEPDVEITWLVAKVQDNPQTVAYQVVYKIGGIEKPMIQGQF